MYLGPEGRHVSLSITPDNAVYNADCRCIGAVPAPLSVPDGQTTAQEPKHYGVRQDPIPSSAIAAAVVRQSDYLRIARDSTGIPNCQADSARALRHQPRRTDFLREVAAILP
jgi:hypothetical protein